MKVRRALGGLLIFGALNAFGGGCYGLSGAPGVPLAWLEGTPFSNYFLPSLILLFVVGGSLLTAGAAVLARARFARLTAAAAGGILLIWITVQLALIGHVSWMQPATAIAGVVIVVLTYLLDGAGD
jgi:hypothetical protein